MVQYARGTLEPVAYGWVLAGLLDFWETSIPQGDDLPEDYRLFRQRYLAALKADLGVTRGCQRRCHYDEMAYFYLLLGSSHGARFMLGVQGENNLPKQHLLVLVDGGKGLWRSFLDGYLNRIEPEREDRILDDCNRMFAALHCELNRIRTLQP